VRGATSEYGIEFLIMLAHHVYWIGLSIDKARKIMEFYTKIGIPKSQAEKMLYQLANDWQSGKAPDNSQTDLIPSCQPDLTPYKLNGYDSRISDGSNFRWLVLFC